MDQNYAKQAIRGTTIRQSYEGPGLGATNLTGPAVSDPTLTSKAHELLHHVGALEQEHGRLRALLFGSYTEPPEGIEAKNPREPGVEEMLHSACERIASLVGDVATINGRIG